MSFNNETDSTEKTDGQQKPEKPAHLFKPGQSGNPAGRPKGSRHRLGEAFVADLLAAWETKGIAAINTVIEQRPHEFLKVVAGILPKQIEVKETAMDELSDDELARVLGAVRDQLTAATVAAARNGGSKAPVAKPVEGIQPLH